MTGSAPLTGATPCPFEGCPGAVELGHCLVTLERVDFTTRQHSAAPFPSEPAGARDPLPVDGPGRPARVVMPPETADPTALPEITLEERAAGRRGDGDRTDPRVDPLSLRVLKLPPSGLLADQYRVIRPLGYGGMGQVFLALDSNVDLREVAVKILHPEQGTGAAVPPSILLRERKELVDLNHDDIIRVYNYGHHPGVGDFLVLQYVDGLTLDEVRGRARRDPDEFGGSRFHEFVLAYGIRILSALGYLHAAGKVYGDLKPDNLMHDGAATKIIDVGSVREAGRPGPYTLAFRAPTAGPRGEYGPQDDLFSLGETLRVLSGLGTHHRELAALAAGTGLTASADPDTGPEPATGTALSSGRLAHAARHMTAPAPEGLGLVSLARVLHRATHVKREERFAHAQEMEQQLRGVLRELRSLRTREETFEPSPLFLQSSYALDAQLGAAPPVSRWATDGARTARQYDPPPSGEVARGLPVPRPDPEDPQHGPLDRLTDDDPATLLQRTSTLDGSPEVHLLRCRLQLRAAQAAERTRDAYEAGMTEAAAELDKAITTLGMSRVPYDWRIDWHRGLLALAQDHVRVARDHFDRVYAAIPGEYAPKLALGHCAERLGEWQAALTFYEAVRLRNPSLGSAAFGTARALLHLGGPNPARSAIRALHKVPNHSRHHTAARAAAVRISVAHTVDARDLGTVLNRLARLFHEHGLTDEQARMRMTTAVWEKARELLDAGALTGADLATLHSEADPRLGFPADRTGLGTDLSRLYQGLAHQVARSPDAVPGCGVDTGALAERLLDLAYGVRPVSWRHHRDSPWFGRRAIAWLRTVAAERARSTTPPSR
ncbi:tetratricopeptide repeat protein [Streptomyces sp. NPDC002004]